MMATSLVVLLVALTFVLSLLRLADASHSGINGTLGSRVGKAYFKIECQVSHRNNDDPILFPRQPGRSHSHDYFGSTAVNAYTSRTSQLLQGNTSCNPPGAKSGYWTPTLYLYNQTTKSYDPKPPRVITVYYFNRYHMPKTIESFPQGLKMVCGNALAKRPQDISVNRVQWMCGEDAQGRKYRNFPRKCRWLVLGRVFCPSCWDGRLTSPDSRSHMAFTNPRTAECPASHPRRLPGIHVTLTYDFSGTHWPRGGISNKQNPPLAKLSTIDGAGWQLHMDVWEAWDPQALKDRMETCLYGGLQCGPDGTQHAPHKPSLGA